MSPANPDVPSTGSASSTDEVPKQINYSPRIQSLDVLRGIAVIFALFISVWFFGGFSNNTQTALLLSSKGINYRLFGAMEILLDGKMRALIAIVFGASMLLFLTKDNQKGELPTHELFIRRQMWLIAFGIVNGLLFLWTRDILFHLGIMGILMFPFIRLSSRGLMLAAVFVTLIYSGKYYWKYSDEKKMYNKYVAVTAVEKKIAAKDSINKANKVTDAKKDTLTKKQVEEKGAWEGLVGGLKYDPKKDDRDIKEMRKTSYGSLYNYLLPRLQQREAQWTYQWGIWDLASMIFLGMALLRFGFFTGKFSKSQYLLIGLAGITIGVLMGWFRVHFQQFTLFDYGKYISNHWYPHNILFPFERGFLTLGYISFVIFLLQAGVFKMLWRGLSYVGQLALTNYLMQSIVCTLFFTGIGMGYFARLTQYQLYLFVAEVSIFQIVFSTLWLRAFHIGPAEWLWRSLTYGRRLPFKKRKKDIIQSTSPLLS